jgi:sugar phosphate isomerase/epimerase
MDERLAPPLERIVDETRALGLECLQICENARPLALSDGQWSRLIDHAGEVGLALELGCMTLRVPVLERYLQRAAAIPSSTLRIVLEEDEPPSRDDLAAFLDAAAAATTRAGARLAIENHFHVPCRLLAELAGNYPRERVMFCLDSANSLRNFEAVEQVWDLLGPRACMYHLKDYRVTGGNVGFSVSGAPLGTGQFDVSAFLERAWGRDPGAPVFLENWVPSTGDREADIAADRRWLAESLRNLQNLPVFSRRA